MAYYPSVQQFFLLFFTSEENIYLLLVLDTKETNTTNLERLKLLPS